MTHSIAEFVALTEAIVAMACEYDDTAMNTVVRWARLQADTASRTNDVLPSVIAGFSERRSQRLATCPHSEELLGDDIEQLLGSNNWQQVGYLNDVTSLFILSLVLEDQEQSVYSLWQRIYSARATGNTKAGNAQQALLGIFVRHSALAEEPYRTQLEALPALPWAIGLVRLTELSMLLERGFPPQEPYSAKERQLLAQLVPPQVRRTRHATTWLREYGSNIKAENDQIERITPLWILHPVAGALSRYVQLLHASVVQQRTTEAVILCRSLLERAISDCCLAANVQGDNKMNRRITMLEQHHFLSAAGARDARDIWQLGNKVIHQDPDFVKDSFPVVEKLMRILSELRPLLEILVTPLSDRLDSYEGDNDAPATDT